jgi:hypothetical protein
LPFKEAGPGGYDARQPHSRSFFGRLVGKSLEAQLLIAAWNTLLTTLGCLVLGLPGERRDGCGVLQIRSAL